MVPFLWIKWKKRNVLCRVSKTGKWHKSLEETTTHNCRENENQWRRDYSQIEILSTRKLDDLVIAT